MTDDPAIVNGDAQGEGWFYKLQPADTAELDDLLDTDAYAELID
ncbi:MAG: hypothetical protein ACR2RD_15050 [Woeseiaceae bacterium]